MVKYDTPENRARALAAAKAAKQLNDKYNTKENRQLVYGKARELYKKHNTPKNRAAAIAGAKAVYNLFKGGKKIRTKKSMKTRKSKSKKSKTRKSKSKRSKSKTSKRK
jgi:hypothetical protein